jgi:DnaK suppressor protein
VKTTSTEAAAPAVAHRTLLSAMLAEQERFRIEQIAELSATATAESDGASEIRAVVLAGATAELAGTRAARARLADGSYGRCGRCTTPLALEQLEVMPHAEFCPSCRREARR